MKHDIHNDELVAFYNKVEEGVITLFGTYERAAAYFDKVGSLDDLWTTTESCYRGGWSAARTASTWFQINVQKADKLSTVAAKLVPAKPVPAKRGYYRSTPEIEPAVLAAREARKQRWKMAAIPF
jgi:hypothetical protein